VVETLHKETWTSARDTTDGDSGYPNDWFEVGWYTGSDHFKVTRGFLAFDTDDLPPGAEVTDAEVRLCCYLKSWENQYTDSMYVCGGLQSSEIDERDFNNFVGWHTDLSGQNGPYDGPIVGRFAWEDVEEEEYVTFPLSEASYSWIEAGNAKGAMLTDFDFDDVEPPCNGCLWEWIRFYGAWYDTTRAARLKVEYSE
jgi:hypothetical protein